MEGTYTIWLGSETVGTAVVERQGLYYWFYCKCRLHSEVICRVTVSCGGKHENLGILVPMGNDYCLTRKIPIKLFASGTPEFWITPKQTKGQDIRVDVYPEEPFQYITKLENAYIDKSRGKLTIIIRDGVYN